MLRNELGIALGGGAVLFWCFQTQFILSIRRLSLSKKVQQMRSILCMQTSAYRRLCAPEKNLASFVDVILDEPRTTPRTLLCFAKRFLIR